MDNLVLPTGRRIDAVLGEKVLKHLLHLPLPYFEARPTGTLVARLHGVEQLREFISGAAVSLVLDLPFLLIFLAVMFSYSWQLTLIALGIMALIVTGPASSWFRSSASGWTSSSCSAHATKPSSPSIWPVWPR